MVTGILEKVFPTKNNDKDLIESVQKGSRLAFNNLVNKYKNDVFNICCRFFGNQTEADDVTQDVFLKILNSINSFSHKSSFSTWLYRITLNTCKNKISSLEYKNKKKTFNIFDTLGFLYNSKCCQIADNCRPIIELIENQEKDKMIQKAISNLPVQFRELVILRDIEGFSYEDISEICKMNIGTVKSRLSKGRNILKDELKDIIQ